MPSSKRHHRRRKEFGSRTGRVERLRNLANGAVQFIRKSPWTGVTFVGLMLLGGLIWWQHSRELTSVQMTDEELFDEWAETDSWSGKSTDSADARSVSSVDHDESGNDLEEAVADRGAVESEPSLALSAREPAADSEPSEMKQMPSPRPKATGWQPRENTVQPVAGDPPQRPPHWSRAERDEQPQEATVTDAIWLSGVIEDVIEAPRISPASGQKQDADRFSRDESETSEIPTLSTLEIEQ